MCISLIWSYYIFFGCFLSFRGQSSAVMTIWTSQTMGCPILILFLASIGTLGCTLTDIPVLKLIPRYLKVSVLLILCPLILISGEHFLWRFLLTSIIAHLLGASCSLFAVHQSDISFKASWPFNNSSLLEFSLTRTTWSSAYAMVSMHMDSRRSRFCLKIRFQRAGPKTEPWGQSLFTVFSMILGPSLMSTLLPFMQPQMMRNSFFGQFIFFSKQSTLGHQTLSKDFDMSKKIASAY